MSARVGAALAAAGMLLGALSACTPAPDPKPTKTALFASEEEAFTAAEETYRAYLAAYESLDFTDPGAYEETAPYLTGSYAASERKGLSELRAEGLVRSGVSELVGFRGVSFDNQKELFARACNDVSDVDIVDLEGTSVVPPDRPDRYALDLTFKVVDGALRLAEAQAVEDPECI